MADIIKCKDCKYFQKWRHSSEVTEKYGQLYSCELLVITDPSPDDYCSKAKEKEKPKTGHWIKIYLTDTGDIDGQCSECGFIHTFINRHTSQYNYCPNCGIKMEGEEIK